MMRIVPYCQKDLEAVNIQELHNSHEEADTRMFFLARSLNFKNSVTKSTDSDLLFVFLSNAEYFARQLFLYYNMEGNKHTMLTV